MYFAKLKNAFKKFKLIEYYARQAEQYGMQYRAFSIFSILNYSFPNFMWSKGIIDGYIILSLKFVAGVLCTVLLMKEYWQPKLQKYFPIYWYFTLFFCLPFTMTVMVLNHNFANGWIVITLLSIFLLASLVSWKDYIIILPLGIILAIVFFNIIGGNTKLLTLNTETKFWSFYAVLFASLIGLIFTRNKELLERERDESAKSIAGMIAHEVRNPLFALGGGIYGLKKAIDKQDTSKVKEILSFIDKTMLETNFIIQMILMNLKGIDDGETYKNLSIKECINEALQEYPFTSDEVDKVSYNCRDDFIFKGNRVLMKHIIFNLLKNSTSFIKSKASATITLITETYKSENLLIFMDTGSGIPPYILNDLFTSFNSSRTNGAGLGLYFCYKVMKSFNGDISCDSAEGEYTIFTLSFQKVD